MDNRETNEIRPEREMCQWGIPEFPKSVRDWFTAVSKLNGKTVPEMLEMVIMDWKARNQNKVNFTAEEKANND